jgi:hypothetical protein
MSRVYLPVRAHSTQASRPATRNPVSSKPGDVAGRDGLPHLCQEPVQPAGRAGGKRGDRPGRQRDAEQLGQRQRGAVLGQEPPGMQVDDGTLVCSRVGRSTTRSGLQCRCAPPVRSGIKPGDRFGGS